MLVELDTVWATLKLYVPAPPVVPVSWEVMMVFAATALPPSLTRENRAMAPVGGPVTVSVVPEMVPMKAVEPVATGQ
jgi:hypothetical protein